MTEDPLRTVVLLKWHIMKRVMMYPGTRVTQNRMSPMFKLGYSESGSVFLSTRVPRAGDPGTRAPGRVAQAARELRRKRT
eukprot:3251762-Rhodomonas_salina.1